MEKSMLLQTIGDTPQNRMLDFLIEGRGLEYSITDIADGCGISRPTVYKILPKLLKEGAVKITRKIGRISLYAIAEENERVKALLRLEQLLLQNSFEKFEQRGVARADSKTVRPLPA